MTAPEIYARQLRKQKEGFPLWEPDPGRKSAVEIADVGYIFKGAFKRLFNVSKERNDPSNDLGVPGEYTPLVVGEIHQNTALPPGSIRSESVSGHTGELGLAGGSLIPAGGGFSFRCEDKEGAVLILGDCAYRQDVLGQQRFLEYIRAHHQSWLALANHPDNARGIAIEDLILVTGCDKTSKWACAAFSESSHDSSISFRVGQDIAAGSLVWGRWEESHAGRKHSGPRRLIPPDPQTPQPAIDTGNQESQSETEHTPPPEATEAFAPTQSNQCVFLRGYRICDRTTFIRRKLRIVTTAYDGFDYVFQDIFPGFKRGKTSENSGGRSKPASDSRQWLGEDGTRHADLPSSILLSGPEGQGDLPISIGPDLLDVLENEELDVFLQTSYDREPTLLDILLYYILANSDAQLAIVHDDDLKPFLQEIINVEDFGRWLRKRVPEIHVDDKKAGMLKATYKKSDRPTLTRLDTFSEAHFGDYGLPDLTGQIERDGDSSLGGGYANIYEGEWIRSDGVKKVAVRVLRPGSTPEAHQRQLRFMREWIQFQHENILSLCGICTDFSPIPAAISPWMHYRDVIEYLEQQGPSCTSLGRLNLLSGVASALSYLHDRTPEIIHCDIKGANVLVSANREAILAGFGNSRTSEDEDKEVDGQAESSVRWMAPELLAPENSPVPHKLSTMSDVYAFGCLMIEIISGQMPWFNMERDVLVLQQVINKQNPPVPDKTYLPMDVKGLMDECWSSDVYARPTMSDVSSSISHCAGKMNEVGIPPAYTVQRSSPPPPFTPSLPQETISSRILASALAPSYESTELTSKGKKKELSPPALVRLGAEEFIAELKPIAALTPVLDIVQKIIETCEKVHSNRSEATQLQERCRYLILALRDESKALENTQMVQLVTGFTRQLNHILAITSKWLSLTRWKSFLQLDPISEDIKRCHEKLMIVAETLRHNDFQVARKEDHAELMRILTELREDPVVDTEPREQTAILLQILQQQLHISTQDSEQYHALQQSLYQIQKKSGELLPNTNLKAGEARRIGKFPVGGNAAYDIWEGVWLGREKVALKTIRGIHVSPDAQKRFEREVEIWREVWTLDRGRYILPFYGACFEDGPHPYVVSPWMDNGVVMQYLQMFPTANRRNIIKGIANGISLLHNRKPRPIVHGDVKAANILIDDSGQPLLAEFGLSKILEDITGVPFTQSKGMSESYRWFAPELCSAPGVLSTFSDVFAYGMTCVEIMTGQPPFSHIKRTTEVLIEMQKGERPKKPKDPVIRGRGLDDHLWDLLTQCWAEKPEDRPTIDQVIASL